MRYPGKTVTCQPSTAKRLRTLLSWVIFLVIGGAGCTLFNIHIGPQVSALKEKVISGKGEEKILLVDIHGVINNRKSRSLLGSTVEMGMVERIKEILEKAEEDEDVKALLLRINSPGGTVTSSDIIYNELKQFKKRKNIKIYAVFMDLAASGGYYVALAADRIFIHPTSITGSIGVIAMKVNLEELMKKLGMDWEVVKSGDKKDFMSPLRPFTEEERKLFQETIDSFHRRFVKIIVENRPGLDLAAVNILADGRIYTARQALENKLVDQIGYLDDVVEFIKSDLGIPDLTVNTYYRSGQYKSNIYSSLSGSLNINLVNIDLSAIPLNTPPLFMYLWMP